MRKGSIVALAGGVGAARFLSGLVRVIDPRALTIIVNTGDDRDFFGLRVCPDLDIVTYTLAGVVRSDTGWGIEGDTTATLEALRRFRKDAWFGLGDRDLATHIHRTERLRAGETLSAVAAEIARAFGVEPTILPMSDDPAPTRVSRSGGHVTDFEEYLVRDGAPDDVVDVDLSAASRARPAPGVLEAIEEAHILLLCPSNPVVSIGTIRAIPGVDERLRVRRRTVAVSPIVGGAPVKGPADRLLRAVGVEVTAVGVASLYREIIGGMVVDSVDAELVPSIEALGMRARVENTLMRSPEIAESLARATLDLAETLG
jgi:LPPG:FO 2-phospho-L-lactate transferase